MTFEQKLDKYAELTVKVGLNLQPGQPLLITAPIGTEQIIRKIARQAYLAGAADVQVNWYDEEIKRTHYELAPDEAFKKFPGWLVKANDDLVVAGGAILQVDAEDPDLLKGIFTDRILNFEKARGDALEYFYEAIDTNRISWSIIAVPSKKWADKIFPHLEEEKRVPTLWEKIFEATRIDLENPIDGWRTHISGLKQKADELNKLRIRKLHYKAEGTDLAIELPEKHIWLTGSSVNKEGTTFVANMPTEEVYTCPLRTGVNGYVTSTKPLAYQGNVIEEFTLHFKEGKITSVKAKEGQELLEKLIQTDEGASFLGEVALVPHDSPISNSGILFFNTLFDENASNHLAIGSAYPTCYEDGSALSVEERVAAGLNDSIVHEDFMIGSEEMDIDGELQDGTTIAIFRKGNWAI